MPQNASFASPASTPLNPWRLGAVAERQLTVTYLPLNQDQTVGNVLRDSDASKRVLGMRATFTKYRDELAVLAGCGRPLVPVLNFVAADGHRAAEERERALAWTDPLTGLPNRHAFMERAERAQTAAVRGASVCKRARSRN